MSLKEIPQGRALIYILLLGLIPLLMAAVQFYNKNEALTALDNTLEEVQHEALVREKRQALNMIVRNHFRDADHFYIDKYVETLDFLEPETEALQKIVNNKNLPEDDISKKRLDFLTGPQNNLIFNEGAVQKFPFFQETVETLLHAVEVNNEDLKKILARIEGVDIGPYKPATNRPQLLVLDFRLDRKKLNEKNEVFLLNMKLLKREYQ